MQDTSYKLQVTSYKLQVTSYKLQATSYKLQATSHKLQATSYTLQATSYKLQVTTSYYKLLQVTQVTSYKLLHDAGVQVPAGAGRRGGGAQGAAARHDRQT